MPELPEVETVRLGIEKALRGQKVVRVEVNRRDLRVVVPEDFEKTLTGSKIESFMRRGKYIIMENDRERFAILHLGMSGRVRIFDPDAQYELQKHDHVVITAQNGVRAVYNDPRRFGFFYTLSPQKKWQDVPPFNVMGLEPLDGWSGLHLHDSLKSRRTPIKTALLDQSVVAGLGNIYVCEALFQAGISPLRIANTLTKDEAKHLAACSIDVLQRAIAAGGSTLKDYQHTNGELGYFQQGFVVYGREGDICTSKECEQKIIRIVQAGRSTFYCSVCQN